MSRGTQQIHDVHLRANCKAFLFFNRGPAKGSSAEGMGVRARARAHAPALRTAAPRPHTADVTTARGECQCVLSALRVLCAVCERARVSLQTAARAERVAFLCSHMSRARSSWSCMGAHQGRGDPTSTCASWFTPCEPVDLHSPGVRSVHPYNDAIDGIGGVCAERATPRTFGACAEE